MSLVDDYTILWRLSSSQFAFTTLEFSFATLSQLVVGFIYGALAGVMSSLMMGMKASEQAKALKMQTVRAWMSARKLQRPLQAAILNHYQSQFKTNAMYDEQALLAELPPAISGRVAFTLFNKFIVRIPMFRGVSLSVLPRHSPTLAAVFD